MTSVLENKEKLERGELLSDTDRTIIGHVKKVIGEFGGEVIVRCVGGWVRDRLLGHESDDLDLTAECDDWKLFATKLQNEFDPTHKIAFIEAKVEQSKNVSSARLRLSEGVWVDVCGLQAEEGSASPATAESDARRRDFTVNAMFFNVNTSKVEDFVGGIEDLTNGNLRTPVDPRITFTADPLRIIRGFRFACTYGFSIDEGIFATGPIVREQLEQTTSQERIVTELTKITKSKCPGLVVDFLVRSELFTAVFDKNRNLLDSEAPTRAKVALERCQEMDDNLMVLLAAIYLHVLQEPLGPKTKKMPVVKFMGFPVKLSQSCEKLALGVQTFRTIVEKLSRLTVGRWIRSIGAIWRTVRCILSPEELKYFDETVTPFVADQNLENAFEIKPLMNGTELCREFNLKPGRIVASKLEELIDWQLENPNGTAGDYIKFVKDRTVPEV